MCMNKHRSLDDTFFFFFFPVPAACAEAHGAGPEHVVGGDGQAANHAAEGCPGTHDGQEDGQGTDAQLLHVR